MKSKKTISFSEPFQLDFSSVEKRISRVLRSPNWSKGKFLEDFEKECRKFLGVKYAIAVSSCTSGLCLALASLKKKGEVIVPGFSFPAVANAVVLNGLKPVFVDVEPHYGNIDPSLVESFISSKTVAILPVCNYGFPPDLEQLEKISKKHAVPLVVDSAQSFGASFKNKKCGGFGDAEVFSLSPSKILTTAEGGVITTNNKQIADFVRMGRNYGKSEKGLFQFAGMSCRLSEFHSVIGIEMLKNINKILKQRYLIAKKYYEELKGTPHTAFPPLLKQIKPSFNYLPIFIDSVKRGNRRNRVLRALQKNGIDARSYFSPPAYRHPAFKRYIPAGYHLKICDQLASRCLTLPLYPGMDTKDVTRVCNIIKKSL